MAIAIIVPIPVYVDNVKVGDATAGTYSLNNGTELVHADAGTAIQAGRNTCSMSLQTIVPRRGMKARLFEALLKKKIVKVRLPLDAKHHSFEGIVQTGEASWQWANGACSGSFSFIGVEPEIA
jgi:hypothetical protein